MHLIALNSITETSLKLPSQQHIASRTARCQAETLWCNCLDELFWLEPFSQSRAEPTSETLRSIMDRCFTSKSGSSGASPGSSAHPARTASISASGDAAHEDIGSAEQPAVKLNCLQDVRCWLASQEVVNSNLDIAPIREAVAVLSRTPRPKKKDVRPLQSKWSVVQRNQGKPRPSAEVINEFEHKVLQAAQKLQQQLASDLGKLAAVAPNSAAQPATSIVAGAVQPASRKRAAEQRETAQVPRRADRDLPASDPRNLITRTEGVCLQCGQWRALEEVNPHLCPVCKWPRLLDCKSWCDSLPTEEAPVKRISQAIAALLMPNSRKRLSQLESMCKDWNVAQRRDQKRRALAEIESDLEKQIKQETQRLRTCYAQHGRCSSVAATRPRA